MKRKCFGTWLLSLSLMLPMMLTGCWDRVEIENRGFAVAMAIDQSSEAYGDDRFTVSLSVPELSRDEEKGAASDTSIQTASGQTVTEALRKLDAGTEKKLYLGQAKLIVLGEALTHDQALFHSLWNALNAHTDLDRQVYVLAAKGNASEILTNGQPNGQPNDQLNDQPSSPSNEQASESLPGLFAAEIYRNKEKTMGSTFEQPFEKINAALLASNGTLIPVAEKKDGALVLSGALAVKDFKGAGMLDGDETRGYLWCLPDKCQGAVLTLKSEKSEGTFETNGTRFSSNGFNVPSGLETRYMPMTVKKHRADISFIENAAVGDGHLICTPTIRVTGRLDENNTMEDTLFLAACYSEMIKEEVTRTFNKMQLELATDGYGWLETLRKTNYRLFQKYANDWPRAFAEMEIAPAVTVAIEENGST